MNTINVFSISHLLLWVVVLAQVYLILALLRQVGVLNLRIGPAGARTLSQGPEVGAEAPAFQLADLRDADQAVRVPPTTGRDLMLVFTSPNCSSCQLLAPGIKALASETHEIDWAIIAFGSPSECVRFQETYFARSPRRIRFCHGSEAIRDLYQVYTTPYAVHVQSDGRVRAAGLVNHIEHLENMLDSRTTPATSNPVTPAHGDQRSSDTHVTDGVPASLDRHGSGRSPTSPAERHDGRPSAGLIEEPS